MNTPNTQVFHSPLQINRKRSIFRGKLCSLCPLSSFLTKPFWVMRVRQRVKLTPNKHVWTKTGLSQNSQLQHEQRLPVDTFEITVTFIEKLQTFLLIFTLCKNHLVGRIKPWPVGRKIDTPGLRDILKVSVSSYSVLVIPHLGSYLIRPMI